MKELKEKKNTTKEKIKRKLKYISMNALIAFTAFSPIVHAELDTGDVTNSVNKILNLLSSLLYFTAAVLTIMAIYQFSSANAEQDPNAKTKASKILGYAIGTGVAGFAISTVLSGLVSKLFG